MYFSLIRSYVQLGILEKKFIAKIGKSNLRFLVSVREKDSNESHLKKEKLENKRFITIIYDNIFCAFFINLLSSL